MKSKVISGRLQWENEQRVLHEDCSIDMEVCWSQIRKIISKWSSLKGENHFRAVLPPIAVSPQTSQVTVTPPLNFDICPNN